MDAIVQAILNLSKLEVSLIKISDATPTYASQGLYLNTLS
jgi:hypothetical protein